MFAGAVDYAGAPFITIVHVLRRDVHEAERFRVFRDRLRGDRELRAKYVAVNREKIAVIHEVLGRAFDEPTP